MLARFLLAKRCLLVRCRVHRHPSWRRHHRPLTVQSSSLSRETRHRAREVKFLVPREMAPEIRDWAGRRLRADVHGGGDSGDEYRITSLYCDTSALDVFHRRGSFGRAKYRVRRYGTMADVFLERKLRTNLLLAKRRTSVPLIALAHLNAPDVASTWPGWWFCERVKVRQLAPTCQVSYRRNARVGSVPGGLLRLTIDDDLRVLPAEDFRFRDERGQPLLPQHLIVELKFTGDMPPLFHLFLDRFQLQRASISKYRLALGALRNAPARSPARPVEERPTRDTLLAPCSPTGNRVPETDALVLS